MTSPFMENIENCCLPYWDSDLDIEVGNWAFSNLERRSRDNIYLGGETLQDLGERALALGSELLYFNCGGRCGGTLSWDAADSKDRESFEMYPFALIFGYSPAMDRYAVKISEAVEDFRLGSVRAGVAQCTFRNEGIPIADYKVIAMLLARPGIDENKCLRDVLAVEPGDAGDPLIPSYAGRLGFVHAPVEYETDTAVGLLLSHRLVDFQLEATRSVVGPSPDIPLPVYIDIGEQIFDKIRQ